MERDEWTKPKPGNQYKKALEEAFQNEYKRNPIVLVLGSIAFLAGLIHLCIQLILWVL